MGANFRIKGPVIYRAAVVRDFSIISTKHSSLMQFFVLATEIRCIFLFSVSPDSQEIELCFPILRKGPPSMANKNDNIGTLLLIRS